MRLALAVVPVEDLAASAAFYRAAFGLTVNVDEPVYVEMRDDRGMRLGLYRKDAWAKLVGRPAAGVPSGTLAPVELYFTCDDLDAAIERIVAAGAEVLSERSARDWGDECAYFADPNGNVLVLARPL